MNVKGMGKKIFIIASVALLALLTSACGAAAPIPTPEQSLIETGEETGESGETGQLFPLEESAHIHAEGTTDETLGRHQEEHEMKESAVEGGGGEGDVLEITLHAGESNGLAFDPTVIEIPVGRRVKVTLMNDGRLEHDFEVAALPAEHVETVHGMESSSQMGATGHGATDHKAGIVAAHAMSGMKASVMFTPTRAGEYEFYCTIPGHKEAGVWWAS